MLNRLDYASLLWAGPKIAACEGAAPHRDARQGHSIWRQPTPPLLAPRHPRAPAAGQRCAHRAAGLQGHAAECHAHHILQAELTVQLSHWGAGAGWPARRGEAGMCQRCCYSPRCAGGARRLGCCLRGGSLSLVLHLESRRRPLSLALCSFHSSTAVVLFPLFSFCSRQPH